MKRLLVPLTFFIVLLFSVWSNRVNIVVWALPKILNVTNPILSEGSSNWQDGPKEKDKSDSRPNIIIILADDLGFNDVSLYNGGASDGSLMTPNIDSIAKDGVLFENGYAANAMCAQSRASIMTGRYSTRFGFEFTPIFPIALTVFQWMDDIQDPELKLEISKELVPMGKDLFDAGMPTEEITIAEILKDVGYYTAHIGKWHLGDSRGQLDIYHPNDQGFDDSLILSSGLYLPENHPDVVNAKFNHGVDKMVWASSQFSASFNKSPEFTPESYLTDYYTDEAIKVIEKNQNRPFFLYLGHWAVHNPLQALKSDFDLFADHHMNHNMQVYSGMIEALDRSVGRIIDSLEEHNLTDNTLIILTSDNGGAGYIELPDINKPYRGWKLTHFEGGIHIPFMAKWPNKITPGTKFDLPIHHTDIFSTIAAAANATIPNDRKIDGVDLMPFITGANTSMPHETLFWKQGHNQTVLHNGWKLIRTNTPDKKWLFNLNEDPTERINLAYSELEKLSLLEELLNEHESEQAPSLWPSVLNAPILIDKAGNTGENYKKGDEYIYWPN